MLPFICFGQNYHLQPDNNLKKFKFSSLELGELDKLKIDELFLDLKKTSVDTTKYVYAHSILSFGNLLGHLGAYGMAKKYISKANKLERLYHFKGVINFEINNNAALSFSQKQYADAITQYKNGLKQKGLKPIDFAAAHNNIGYSYLKLKVLDSAEYHLNMSLTAIDFDSIHETSFFVSINDNLGCIYFETKKYEQALTLFRQNLRLAIQIKDLRRENQARIQIARCLSFQGNWMESKRILDALNISQIPLKYKEFSLLYHLYLDVRKDYYLNIGNSVEAQKIVEQKNSIRLIENQHKTALLDYTIQQYDMLSAEQSRAKLRLSKINQKNIQEKAEKDKSILILILSLSVFSLGLAILFWRYRLIRAKSKISEGTILRMKIESQLELEKEIKENLKGDIASKDSNIVDMSMEIRRQQSWINDVANKLLSNINSSQEKEHLRQVINEIKFQLMTDRKQQTIYQQVDKSTRSFNDQLRSTYPNLTKTEVELCSLIRLNLSNKEIAAFRGVQYESIIMSRKRLRKKLNMKPGEDLYNKVKSIGT